MALALALALALSGLALLTSLPNTDSFMFTSEWPVHHLIYSNRFVLVSAIQLHFSCRL